MNFLKTMKSRYRKIKSTVELKENLRANLIGQALLWFNCKETEINNMDEFESLFLANY